VRLAFPQRAVVGWRLFFGILPLVAIGCQLATHREHGFEVINFFSYFTNLANLFGAGTLLMGAWLTFRRRASANGDLVRAIATVSMLVVGVVFSVLLRNVDLGSLKPWINFVLHYLMPVVIVVDWIVQPPLRMLRLRELVLCQIAPTVYLAYVLVRGAWVGWYPYPFLNPSLVGGYGRVAMYAVGIAGVFISGGMVLFWVARRCQGQHGWRSPLRR
jgi:hypothetical protein